MTSQGPVDGRSPDETQNGAERTAPFRPDNLYDGLTYNVFEQRVQVDHAFLLSVFILLAAASLLVPLSKLTGLGSVIGYLIAGVLIGPSVFGLIAEPQTILHFSEFGVVMMLFLIGLELQPRELWGMRAKLIGLGGLQVGLTLVAIAVAANSLGYPLSISIVIGMAFALSSTAVALQVMQDRQILSTTAGQSGFSVLLFQDVIVIAMIAAVHFLATSIGGGAETGHALHEATNNTPAGAHTSTSYGPTGIWRGLAVVGVFVGMILAGRLVVSPLFRFIARSNVRETFTAVALSLVVGTALLMEWLELSAALGAFIAGVVLAESEYRHQLERDIEPFKALLLGLFFMSVGMSLDITVIEADPNLIIGGVLALMTIKFLVLYIVGSAFGMAPSSNLLFSALLCQAGEFGFVLFQFARAENIMDPALISQCSAIIALSMALTPIVLIIHDRFIAPNFASPKTEGERPINQKNKVLVLGFGRVGQMATRLLHTQDIATTLLDHDGDHIEFVKQFGNRVFYGDASDIDLLRMAGAADADVIIIAIDDAEKSTQAAKNIKEHFPKAKIVARGRSRTHVFDLMAIGVDSIERETARAALAMGRSALEFLGVAPARAKQLSDDFLFYDMQLISETWQHRDDQDAMIKNVESGRAFIKQTLNADKNRSIEDDR